LSNKDGDFWGGMEIDVQILDVQMKILECAGGKTFGVFAYF
jgi:hypothetical protein